MSKEPKPMDDAVRSYLASVPLEVIDGGKVDAEPLPTLTMTDEEWAAHDAKIAAKRAAEGAADEASRLASYEHAGFPKRALEAARKANEQHEAIRHVIAWDRGKSILVLSGEAGCGKTVAATWWALRRRAVPTFLRATEFARSSRYDNERRQEWLMSTALVLDDLGTEYLDGKGSFLVDLDELIDRYYADDRPMIITTNCTLPKFRERYGARVCDRIRECGEWMGVAAKSLRGKP